MSEASKRKRRQSDCPPPQTILVLQGGGALGSYQAGVYEALAKEGVEPEWVAGISIGAINSALIAGNPPELRVERLREFWEQVSSSFVAEPLVKAGNARSWFNESSAMWASTFGAPGFFRPRVPPAMFYPSGAAEALSLYDTSPLRETLERLVDFDLLNNNGIRFSVGAVEIESGNFVYFDNTKQKIGPEHIMASGALPPGFPPVEIDGKFYWDGGIVSNTPLDYVLNENLTDPLVIFQVDLFSARGQLPKTLLDVVEREKDIRYSSRTRMNTDVHLRLHRTRKAFRKLLEKLPPSLRDDESVEELKHLWAERPLAIVQLIQHRRAYENSSSDYEFSRRTMLDNWSGGMEDVQKSLEREDWRRIATSQDAAASLDYTRTPAETPGS